MPDRELETVIDLTPDEHEFLHQMASSIENDKAFMGASLRKRMSVIAGAAIQYYRAALFDQSNGQH